MKVPRVLIIAGSDSGGGAGIQADIKTVTMLGGHAMTAITAITAQNTLGVDAVMPVPTEMVLAQIDAVVRDIGVDVVKIGMIGSAETANAVADRLNQLDVPIVFDPVMVASSGAALADEGTIAAFRRLMDIAFVITPNAPELAALTGLPAGNEAELSAAGANLARRHSTYVFAKGGHLEGATVVDRLFDMDGRERHTTGPRIDSRHNHGTGCTLASAIATYLARAEPIGAAVDQAQSFVRLALRAAPGLGGGHGPMGHQQVRLDAGEGPRLNQFALRAGDRPAARDFYTRLGLTLIVDSEAANYLRFEAPGGATLSLYPEGDGVYFEFEDLDLAVARLQRAGFAFEELPADRPWGWRQAWLRDPDGNRICLYQAGENRRFPPWRISTAK